MMSTAFMRNRDHLSQVRLGGQCVRPGGGSPLIESSPNSDVPGSEAPPDLNVSELRDAHRREAGAPEFEQPWRLEHCDFIAAHNATIEAEGLPLDAWRTF
jgi:antitoxin CcdA